MDSFPLQWGLMGRWEEREAASGARLCPVSDVNTWNCSISFTWRRTDRQCVCEREDDRKLDKMDERKKDERSWCAGSEREWEWRTLEESEVSTLHVNAHTCKHYVISRFIRIFIFTLTNNPLQHQIQSAWNFFLKKAARTLPVGCQIISHQNKRSRKNANRSILMRDNERKRCDETAGGHKNSSPPKSPAFFCTDLFFAAVKSSPASWVMERSRLYFSIHYSSLVQALFWKL